MQATEIDQKVRKYNIQEEMIMTYESYKTNLIDALSKAADQNNAALKTDKQMKVNQTDMDSVCLMPHGSTIARVYYVEPLYQDYRNYLLDTCQVPGGFYAARSRAHALRLVVDMMLDPDDPYTALEGGRVTSRQQMNDDDR